MICSGIFVPSPDTDLIELAYAASMLVFMRQAAVPWYEPTPSGDIPADLEEHACQLALNLGLPRLSEGADFDRFQKSWLHNLPSQRQRDLFEIGVLLFRQHGLVAFLQQYPDSPDRDHLWFTLGEIQRLLTHLLTRNGAQAALSHLPHVPQSGDTGDWLRWQGDTARSAVVEALSGSSPEQLRFS
jgi:hypothetical protein